MGHDLEAELPGLDAVMMLRVQAERMHGAFFPSSREYAVRYGLSERRAALLPEHAVVLHPGPMVRGMEIAPAVADARRARCWRRCRTGCTCAWRCCTTCWQGRTWHDARC